jgi:hypothetical protein
MRLEVVVAATLVAAVTGPASGATLQEMDAAGRVLREMSIDVGSSDVSVVEPFLVVNPVEPRQRAGAAVRLDPDGWTVVGFHSSDGGLTWSHRDVPGQADAEMAADPWLYWSPDGTLYLSILAFVPEADDTRVAIWMYESGDGGRSWSDPVQLPWSERGSYDHAIIASQSRPGTREPLYIAATYGLSGIAVLRSESGPGGFTGPEVFVPDDLNNNLGGAVALGSDTVVFTHFSTSTPGGRLPLWAIRSFDGGHSFERTLIRRGVVPWGFPALAVDVSESAYGKRLYAAWLEAAAEGGLDLMLASSDDEGATWSSPVVVNSEQAPVFRGRPFVAVNGDGVVGVTWNDRRNAGAELCSDVYFAASLDGGANFLPETRISRSTTCNPPDLNRRWAMGGDYSNMVTSSDGHFHIVWADARTGVHALYAAEVVVER